MKSGVVWLCAITALAAAVGLAQGGIKGSKHDFSGQEGAGEEGCGACHTTQRDEIPKAPPRWNPGADLSQTFGNDIAWKNEPGTGTRICLRCHDGTVAKAMVSGSRPSRFVNVQNPGLFRPSHGASDHPVGVKYPLVDPGFRPAASVIATGTVTLPNGRVECISCHDPHNDSGLPRFLVTTLGRSTLCLTCHNK